MPPMVTVFSPTLMIAASSFSQVSVVMMALAASVPLSRELFFFSASTRIPAFTFSIGSCIPMTPVEPMVTPSARIFSASAAASAVSLQYPKPSSPVHALAIPEFTITACTGTPLSITCRSHFTGAAFTTLVVKVPAATQGAWLYTSAISVLS